MNRKERRRLKKQEGRKNQAAGMFNPGNPGAPGAPGVGSQGLSAALFQYASGGDFQAAPAVSLADGLPACVNLIEQKKLSEAEDLCTRLRGAHPHQLDVLYLSGLVSARIGRPEKAEEFLRMALAIDDEHADAAMLMGDILDQRNDLNGAVDAYELAAAAMPDAPAPFYRLGYIQQKKKDYEKAVNAYEICLKNDPNQAEVCLNLGYAYFSAGATSTAIKFYRRAIDLNPHSAQPHVNLGAALAQLEDLDNAAAGFRSGLAIDPNSVEGLFGLASVLRQLEEFGEAAEVYGRALTVDPDRANAYWEMGYALEMSGDPHAAEAAYRQCLARIPDHGVAKHLLAALAGDTTQGAPREYVEDLFDDYADSFDQVLTGQLDYAVPGLIRDKLETLPSPNSPAYAHVLDLGGGTGLVAAAIAGFTGDIDGVDLSSKMLEVADREGRYNRTYTSDILAFLTAPQIGRPRYDLVVSGDVFVYMGDLRAVFEGVANRLEPSGVFVFTTEQLGNGGGGGGGGDPYVIRPSGRYAHRETYLRALAAGAGFNVHSIDYIEPRKDGAEIIKGLLCCLIVAG